jgi:hypothetical protein
MYKSSKLSKTSEESPSLSSNTQFPHKFPSSSSKIGGQFSVEDATKQLQRFYDYHKMLVRTIAGWIIQIPEFEVKVELAYHLYMHSEAAKTLRERLIELRNSPSKIDQHTNNKLALLESELKLAHDTPEFIVGIHRVVASYLMDAQYKYIEKTDDLADMPTIRGLKKILVDLEEMCKWSKVVIQVYIDSGYDETSLQIWSSHIQELISCSDDVLDNASSELTSNLRQNHEPAFFRKIDCQRDERFITFANTRDYHKHDNLDEHFTDEYQKNCLELIRVQRDEIDALEVVANILYDLTEAPFEMQMDLARAIWDEARHAQIGHQNLLRLGFDPFKVPCNILGIKVRSPLPPLISLATLNILGEQSIVDSLRQLSKCAYERGDKAIAVSFDFIYSDEIVHLRKGRFWLKRLHPSGNIQIIQEEARVHAIQRLIDEDVIGEDYAINMTSHEVAKGSMSPLR